MDEWKESPATSLCTLFSLDPTKYQSKLSQGNYCTDCCQILLNLDYTFQKLDELQQILLEEKNTVLKLISSHYRILTSKKSKDNSLNTQFGSDNIMRSIASELNLNCSNKACDDVKCSSPNIGSEEDILSDYCDFDYTITRYHESIPSDQRNLIESFPGDWEPEPASNENYNNDYAQNANCLQKDEKLRVKSQGRSMTNPGQKAIPICSFCAGKVFATEAILRTHVRRVHMRILQHKYRCQVERCAQRFVNTSEVNNHYETEHPQIQRSITCGDCSKAYFTQVQLRNHRNAKHGKLVHKCSYCDRTFNCSDKRQCKSHQATHATSRDFLCSNCGKDFKSKKILCIHHYLCPNRSESLTPALIKRCETRCQNVMRQSRSPAILCKICLLRFRNTLSDTTADLENHESLHMLKAPIISCVVAACPLIEGTFTNLTELQAHVREVHNHTGRNYSIGVNCDVCFKIFPRSLLEGHMQESHLT